MLIKEKTIDDERGETILQALCKINDQTIDMMIENWTPSGWEPLIQLEHYLTKEIGLIASDVNIARTIPPPFYRMGLLPLLVSLLQSTNRILTILLEKARDYCEVVMPGYTHWQHAQPMTYGHYLLGLYDTLARAQEDLLQTYDRTNKFELGCGALSGTSFTIDREYAANLLGFSGLIEHSNDAVAATDYLMNILCVLSNIIVPLSRVANDFDIWSSFEMHMVEISDHICNPSSMMPQKKNPAVFEFCRLAVGKVAGSISELITATHAIPFGDVIEVRELAFHLQGTIKTVTEQVNIMGTSIETLTIEKERMLDLAKRGFSTVTELAAILYRKAEIPLREAHGIVADIVRSLVCDGKDATDIDSEIVMNITRDITGKQISLTNDDIAVVTDPVAFVNNHTSIGGVAPIEVLRMVEDRVNQLNSFDRKVNSLLKIQKEANNKLNSAVQGIVG